VVALLALAVLSVVVAPSSRAQVLPDLPPLPAPPAEGNIAADVLGPATATACKTVATVYGLLGPIAAAQLPPELQGLVTEADPYLALVTYACGYLVTPPSGLVCTPDAQLGEVSKEALGLLGLPVSAPAAVQVFYDTVPGIEHVFLRLGLDIGTEASRQLAAALGCGAPAPIAPTEPAAFPTQEAPAALEAPGSGLADVSLARPSIPAVVGRPATPGSTTQRPGTLGQAGGLSYPVKAQAAVLLALPLVLAAGGLAAEPRLRRRGRRRRGGGAPWSDATP